MSKKIKVLKTSHHRNGICGTPFDVALFRDEDKTTKVCIDFGDSNYAVLQTDLLAAGDIAFGSNSWRGDHFIDEVRKQSANMPKQHTPDSFFVVRSVGNQTVKN